MAIYDIDSVLDLIGYGPMQLLMLSAVSLISCFICNEILGIGIVTVSISCEFLPTNAEQSMLASAGFTGLLLAAPFAGYMMDMIGRRKSMLYSSCLSLAASLLSIAMPNFYSFLICRFMVGFFLSGVSSSNITYITEYTQVKLRSTIVTIMSYFFALGTIYVATVAYLLHPLQRILYSMDSFHVRTWRLSLLLNALPGVFAIVLIFMIPESAKYMLSMGDSEGAYKTLNRLCLLNRKQDLESLGVTGLSDRNFRKIDDKKRNFFQRLWHETVPLFRAPLVRIFLICTIIMSCYFFVGNGLALWFMKLRSLMTDDDDDDQTVCDMIQRPVSNTNKKTDMCLEKPPNFIDGIVLGLTNLGCCFCITMLLICFRRSYIQIVYAIVAILCGLSLNVLVRKVHILVALTVFSSSCSTCIPLIASIISDVMPTSMRGKAISWSFMFARLSVLLASVILSNFATSYCLITFNLFVVCIIVVAILVYFLSDY